MGVKEGLNMLVFVELSFVRCKMAQENGIPFSRIFCCGRFHQFVLIVIALYKFEKDEKDFTTQIAVSPTASGGSRSPSAPEVGHRCTGPGTTTTPPSWSGSLQRAPPWMLWTALARGP